MSVVETVGLSKRYRGGVLAVDELTLTVEQGQIYGFLGPNGSGKTTTIGMLVGIVTPTAGNVRLFGESGARALHAARQRIGATLETPNFYPYLSGRDNLRLVAHIKGVERREVDAVLELVGLLPRAADAFRKYSLGMKQRLALAATMLADPELLLLDEPANGLDPEGMREIREILIRLGREGRTIFVSSHLLGEIERTCTHVGILKEGRLLRTGPVEEILRGPFRVELGAADPGALLSAAHDYAGARHVSSDGERVRVELVDDDAAALNRYLAERGVYVHHLARTQPSLEDVFLEVTGASGAHLAGLARTHGRGEEVT